MKNTKDKEKRGKAPIKFPLRKCEQVKIHGRLEKKKREFEL